MTVQISEGPAIVMGYAYRLSLEAEGTLFPAGLELVAQIRASVGADQLLAQLSTDAGGGLTRVSDTRLERRREPIGSEQQCDRAHKPGARQFGAAIGRCVAITGGSISGVALDGGTF